MEKTENTLLTLEVGSPYKPVIERGRRAAGAEKFALVKWRRRYGGFTNSREPRKRHSTGYEAKSHPAHDTAFACVRSLKIEYRRKRNVGGRVTANPARGSETLAGHVLTRDTQMFEKSNSYVLVNSSVTKL